ncbi:MAG TPA: hypothetical protein VFE31_06680 [Opitutaceae bacterium]|jgi:ribosomal protein S12 methylthiotransferase accessory factor YcaO|nr:hypothetical protein [Opitutaceae bacterium]
MLSLAPFLYRHVSAEHRGPIAKVEADKVSLPNHPLYQANAYLRPDLNGGRPSTTVYGSADGTGSSDNPAVAQHKAISEALERWAFMESAHAEPTRSKYCFDLDPTTNGMAAFPGFKHQARKGARMEALERWAIISWWDGRLAAKVTRAPYLNVGMVRIEHDQDGEVVILYHKSAAGHVAYGHAAGSNLPSAAARAAIELARSEYVIARYRARGGLAKIGNFMERRAIHFSTPEGHSQFLERVNSSPDKAAPQWKTRFDGEIEGPWSQFATVWRHAVEMPTYEYLNPNNNFFLC